MRRGEVWRRLAAHYLVVSSNIYLQIATPRVHVLRVFAGDPSADRYPFLVEIEQPIQGRVAADLVEWVLRDALVERIGAVPVDVMREIDRGLRGVLDLST